jgi:hypothetical protein
MATITGRIIPPTQSYQPHLSAPRLLLSTPSQKRHTYSAAHHIAYDSRRLALGARTSASLFALGARTSASLFAVPLVWQIPIEQGDLVIG